MYSIKFRIRMLLPFLRPSKEKARKKLSSFLESAICEIRIANPIAEGAAEELAHLFLKLIDANEIEVETIETFLKGLMERG
ncbi:MAG TPA: hypothetical protein EYP68_05310 [Candidatus Korarchaeota archaeon]|nr:hypothetical protein [Candidatus Korarchaeota archaeon]